MPGTVRFATQQRFVLPGSEKAPLTQSTAPPPPNGLSTPAVHAMMASANTTTAKPAKGSVTVTVVLRPKQTLDASTLGSPGSRMTRAEYARLHGPDEASLELVRSFGKEFGLTMTGPTPGRRAVHLTGSVEAMQKAFGVQLLSQQLDNERYRVRQGSISLPQDLYGHVMAVLGLDNRPQAEPHFRIFPSDQPQMMSARATAKGAAPAAASNGSFTPVQVASLYQFPTGASAAGQTIGIIELGGGFKQADLTAYFKSLGQAVPTVIAVSVDKGKNAPTGKPDGPDGEVMLDIEVAAAVAPGAKIAVYFAPNTDQGFVDAIATAVHDKVNNPSVISISWGSAESRWTKQAMTSMDAACQAAAALGISVTVAAGDNGSSDSVNDGRNHADFPASSPHVLACGGTKLVGAGAAITSEVVWNEDSAGLGATGGGVSDVFPLPTWQSAANVPPPAVNGGGRGVPDVAGNADPTTGYIVRVDGKTSPIGGTSAVAPLWAGLIAVCNAQNKVSAGFLNPALYAAKAKSAFRDITSGNNGAFAAGPGWDACTGLGTPVGTAVVSALASSSAAATRGRKKKAAT